MNIRTGEEITDPKNIAKVYILSLGFWIDLVCAIPIKYMSSSSLLSLIGLLKITRVGNISHIIAQMNAKANHKIVKICLKRC